VLPVSIPKDVAHRVLAVFAERGVEWLEQFPQLVADLATLLRNPRHQVLARSDPVALIRRRILILAERLGYDPRRLVQWGFVLAALAATWAFEDGEGEREVDRWLSCAGVLREADMLAS
jgi:streptomycin 6-kinase